MRVHDVTGRTHWLSVIFWLLEQRWPVLFTIPTAIAAAVTLLAGGGAPTFALTWLTVPLTGIGLPLLWIIHRSRRHDRTKAD